MKIKKVNGMLEITTNIYQAISGALMLDFGNDSIELDEEQADKIAYDIPDFNQDDYNSHYSSLKE